MEKATVIVGFNALGEIEGVVCSVPSEDRAENILVTKGDMSTKIISTTAVMHIEGSVSQIQRIIWRLTKWEEN